jgi:hypothetical protein
MTLNVNGAVYHLALDTRTRSWTRSAVAGARPGARPPGG